MKKWTILIDCLLLCCLLSLVACRFAPFGSYGDSENTSGAATIAGFTPEQIQQVVDDIRNDKAILPVSLSVPAYSFYRFDYSNVAGGHRGATILSHEQAIASPSYGIETTARVLIFESMKARAGYTFDYFTFSDSLSRDRIGAVITAIAAQYSDTGFLLNSSQNIGSTTMVAQAVGELVSGLPLPVQADFVPVPIASPAVDLNLKPAFSDLPATTLTTLFLNEDLHTMYASMTVVGLANYSLFKSNVPAVSQPRPAFRLHKADPEHDITRNYRVSIAPISASGSVNMNLASSPVSIAGVASSQMAVSASGDNTTLVFTYFGDRAIPQRLTADSEKLVLAFTYRDLWDDNCDNSKDKAEGPIVYLNAAGPQKFSGESLNYTTPATKLLCVVIVDNQPIATFTADQNTPVTVDLPIPAGVVATLSCSVIPPTAQAAEASARSLLMTALASDVRPLDTMETASWNKACDASTSVELTSLGRSIFVPTLFKSWFLPEGTYIYQNDPREFTPQVFRKVAAPATPSVVLDMSGYSEAPLHAFSIPISIPSPSPSPIPASFPPVISGIATGVYNIAKTFSILIESGETSEYSIDNGATWNEYSGPVTLSADGIYRIIARNKTTHSTSALVTVTIDATAPQAPAIAGITTGTFTANKTFTVTGAESGGTLYYSLDNGLTNATYTAPVTISDTATCTAWQIDAAGNIGVKAAPILVTIVQGTVTAVQPTSGINNGILNNVQITGIGFSTGVIPRLTRSGQASVTGSSVVVNSPTSLTCSFDLSSIVVGSWSVVVSYADGGIATGTDLFTVQSKTWRKSLGGSLNEADIYCVNAVDGGILVAGTTFSNLNQVTYANGASDIWIARLDDVGTLLWSKFIGGSGSDRCSGLIARGNGYVLAGDTTSTDGDLAGLVGINTYAGKKAMLLNIDLNGVLDSTSPGICPAPPEFPISASDARGGVRSTSDGGCILAGSCFDGSYEYAWAVKFGSALSQEWDVRLTGNGPVTYALDVAQKADGNYLLCGFTDARNGSFFTGGQPIETNDGFIAEISNQGEILLTRCFGGTGVDSCTGVVPLSAGDFYVIGTTGSSDNAVCPLPAGHGTADVMVFKVTADFATASLPLSLGGGGVDSGLRGQLAADGGLLFSGQTTSTDGDVSGNHGSTGDFWFGKVSPAGSLQWQKCFGGTAEDNISSFLIASDGGYLLSGYGSSTDGDLADTGHQVGNDDFVIIREALLPTP